MEYVLARDQYLYFSRGYKYWVRQDFHIRIAAYPEEDIKLPFVHLLRDGSLTVFKGYAWNGASGPTWDTLNSMIGSLIHDVGYQLIRLGLLSSRYKEVFDEILHSLCAQDGMWDWRAGYWRWAVLHFGNGSI